MKSIVEVFGKRRRREQKKCKKVKIKVDEERYRGDIDKRKATRY